MIDKQFRSARIWSNGELRRLGSLFSGEIINVSGGEDVDKEGGFYRDYFPNKSSWYLSNYSAGSFRGFQGRENEILLDLTQELPSDLENRFDVALNHTTLEHIFDVFTAFRNLCMLSRDVVIVVVPFCQVQHESESFKDYWRFTPSALRELFRINGMSVVYESESPQRDAAIYLTMVAARNEEKWKHAMPTWQAVSEAGQWIGEQKNSFLRQTIGRLRKRIPFV
jgi:hypothetical protein